MDLSAALGDGGNNADDEEFDLCEIEPLLVQQETALEQQLQQVRENENEKRGGESTDACCIGSQWSEIEALHRRRKVSDQQKTETVPNQT